MNIYGLCSLAAISSFVAISVLITTQWQQR